MLMRTTWAGKHRQELGVALGVMVVSFGVYWWSAAPNVTLLDSGEFLVAAQHFGVPHPTGYPLWTILAWAFQLLPLGNAAWEINLFSGVCGALASGMAAGVLVNLLRWFLEGRLVGRMVWMPPLLGISFGLMLAFSVSMWSQAVIAEVYTLHALLVAVYLALLYGWVRNPSHDKLMLWAFFVLALSFSNHHLTLTLAPIPYLLILLLRRRALADWIFAGALTLLLGYLCFAILSEEYRVLKTAIRLFWIVGAAGCVFVFLRRFRVRWKLVALLPLAVGAGLLPYAYMPFASSTNPPMNWGYAREKSGFFYSINRTQYAGSLSDQSLRALGRLTGTVAIDDGREAMRRARAKPQDRGPLESAQMWVGFFWQRLNAAFSPLAILGYFASIFFILRYPLAQRTWIYCLHFCFVLAAFLQPVLDAAQVDAMGWWLQMPYHTYTNLIFALLAGLGTGLMLEKLVRHRAVYFWLVPATLFLPVLTFVGSEPVASQRDRWFGWFYGHEMLKDLPAGSVVFGGTDPGRFVPTYMILGESVQPAHVKRDPSFDRRDLYIITQNALGDPYYMNYIRDHYGEGRPSPDGFFERWLGRADAYPPKPLVLPDENEVHEIIRKAAGPDPVTGKPPDEDPAWLVFSAVSQWIWEHNRDEHEFFIEESFPMRWTYDYALPEGLVLRLSREKLEEIPPEVIERDFRFWRDTMQTLFADPNFKRDFDARRSFSKLRCSIGNLYRHRGLKGEAERAYREALEIWPSSVEVLIPLSEMLWEQGRFADSMELIEQAFEHDRNNMSIVRLAALAAQREEFDGKIRQLRGSLERDPSDVSAFEELLSIYAAIGDTNRARDLVGLAWTNFPTNAQAMRVIAGYTESAGMDAENLRAAGLLAQADPLEATAHFLHARALLRGGKTNEAFDAATTATELGGRRMREAILTDPVFAEAVKSEPFRSLGGMREGALPAPPVR
jgi:tetratricopeptide (TPR) repeat protein